MWCGVAAGGIVAIVNQSFVVSSEVSLQIGTMEIAVTGLIRWISCHAARLLNITD